MEPVTTGPARDASSEKTGSDPETVRNSLRRLTFLCERSTYLPTDWETLAEVQAILGRLSAADLAAVHAALEKDMAGKDPYASGSRFLLAEILAAWIQLDPAAAMLAGYRNPRSAAVQAFSTWAQEDPAAALDWLESDGFPAELAGKKDELRTSALHSLLHRDYDRATAEFLKLPPEASKWEGRSGVISNWAAGAVDDPALRERLVAFAKTTGRPEDYARMNESLLRTWPQQDALGMLTYLHELRGYLESADLPANQRPTLDATAVGAAIYREYDRPALEWWMERHADLSEVPAPLQDAMIGWHQKYPEKVNQWFAEQPPSPQRDAMQAALVPAMVATGKMEEAVQAIGNIGDATMRQSAIERLDYVWSKRDPAAAAAWRGKE